jgi:hypothetical protein
MKSYIKAISYYLPEIILTNEQLVKDFPEWTVDKVRGKKHLARSAKIAYLMRRA